MTWGARRSSRRAGNGAREYGGTIIGQLKAMGCRCDYDDERFTMDREYQVAVRKVFVRLVRSRVDLPR